ncbi:MAG: phosphatidate cytidylyltransferase, partial [Draconibacterium sp.]|nr:phosphatidate cytidylyltransferase [Draconibacterium sp.]
MNDIVKRSLTGIAYVAVMLGGIIIHPFIFAPVFGVIMFFTQSEFYKISEQAKFSPQKKFGLILGILLFILFFLAAKNIIPQSFILLSIPFLFFVFIAELFRKKSSALKNGAITLLGLIYVALPFSLLNFIVFRQTPGSSNYYPWILVGIFFIIWIYDSMAYVSGSLLGKHKIAAKISPAKSWEGLIGGTIF